MKKRKLIKEMLKQDLEETKQYNKLLKENLAKEFSYCI